MLCLNFSIWCTKNRIFWSQTAPLPVTLFLWQSLFYFPLIKLMWNFLLWPSVYLMHITIVILHSNYLCKYLCPCTNPFTSLAHYLTRLSPLCSPAPSTMPRMLKTLKTSTKIKRIPMGLNEENYFKYMLHKMIWNIFVTFKTHHCIKMLKKIQL
jgi:hypothetical protein